MQYDVRPLALDELRSEPILPRVHASCEVLGKERLEDVAERIVEDDGSRQAWIVHFRDGQRDGAERQWPVRLEPARASRRAGHERQPLAWQEVAQAEQRSEVVSLPAHPAAIVARQRERLNPREPDADLLDDLVVREPRPEIVPVAVEGLVNGVVRFRLPQDSAQVEDAKVGIGLEMRDQLVQSRRGADTIERRGMYSG